MQPLQQDLERGLAHAAPPDFVALPRGQNHIDEFELAYLVNNTAGLITQTRMMAELRQALSQNTSQAAGKNMCLHPRRLLMPNRPQLEITFVPAPGNDAPCHLSCECFCAETWLKTNKRQGANQKG